DYSTARNTRRSHSVAAIRLPANAESPLSHRRHPSLVQLLTSHFLLLPSDFCPMPVVLIEKQTPQITVLTLNRPERRNALTIELLTELTAEIEVASADEQQRILILRGAGAAF